MKEKKFPEVKVMGYREALEYVRTYKDHPKHEKYAIISMKNPNYDDRSELTFCKGGNCLDVLRLEFSDCTPAIQLPNTVLMTMEDAWKIHDFVEKMPKEVEILMKLMANGMIIGSNAMKKTRKCCQRFNYQKKN